MFAFLVMSFFLFWDKMIFPWRTWLNEYWIWCRCFGNVYLWSSFYLPIHPLLPLLQHYSYQIQSPHFRRAAGFLRGTEVAFRAKKEVKNFDIHWLDLSVRFAFIFVSLRTSHSPRTFISGNLRERKLNQCLQLFQGSSSKFG